MTEDFYDMDVEMDNLGESLEHLYTHEKHLENASLKTMQKFKEFFIDASPCDNDCMFEPNALKSLTTAWLESIESLDECKDDIRKILKSGGYIYDFFLKSYGALKELEKALDEDNNYEK